MKQFLIYLAICFFGNVIAMEEPRNDSVHQRSPRFDVIQGVSEDGVDLVNDSIPDMLQNLTQDQRRVLTHHIAKGNLRLSKGRYLWWQSIAIISEPLSELSRLACAIFPMVPIDLWSQKAANLSVTAAAIGSIALDKIYGFAKRNIKSHEDLEILLRAVREKQIQVESEEDEPEEA